jgi:hypothetical protein
VYSLWFQLRLPDWGSSVELACLGHAVVDKQRSPAYLSLIVEDTVTKVAVSF